MWIDDKHRDMIMYALKAIRHEQEDAAEWGNHQAAANVTHIDAALAQLTKLHDQPAATTQGAMAVLLPGQLYALRVIRRHLRGDHVTSMDLEVAKDILNRLIKSEQGTEEDDRPGD